jgi:hypothetical protein
LSRAQQVYHVEEQTFANTIEKLNLGGSGIISSYYTFPNPIGATDTFVQHQAIATNPTNDQVRNYASGVYFSAGLFEMSLCESADFGSTVNVGATASDNCTNNGTKLK